MGEGNVFTLFTPGGGGVPRPGPDGGRGTYSKVPTPSGQVRMEGGYPSMGQRSIVYIVETGITVFEVNWIFNKDGLLNWFGLWYSSFLTER